MEFAAATNPVKIIFYICKLLHCKWPLMAVLINSEAYSTSAPAYYPKNMKIPGL
jgi:hypothetical protein